MIAKRASIAFPPIHLMRRWFDGSGPTRKYIPPIVMPLLSVVRQGSDTVPVPEVHSVIAVLMGKTGKKFPELSKSNTIGGKPTLGH